MPASQDFTAGYAVTARSTFAVSSAAPTIGMSRSGQGASRLFIPNALDEMRG